MGKHSVCSVCTMVTLSYASDSSVKSACFNLHCVKHLRSPGVFKSRCKFCSLVALAVPPARISEVRKLGKGMEILPSVSPQLACVEPTIGRKGAESMYSNPIICIYGIWWLMNAWYINVAGQTESC